jgi:septal ring factor EnvC (AmiA/AmiB activator)
LEQAITALQRVHGLEKGASHGLQQLADSLKQERDNYADTVKYWEKMVTDLQMERDVMAEKLSRQPENQQERDAEKEVYRREKELGDNKLRELARAIAELTNEKELMHKELAKEREKSSRKERDSTASLEKGMSVYSFPPFFPLSILFPLFPSFFIFFLWPPINK